VMKVIPTCAIAAGKTIMPPVNHAVNVLDQFSIYSSLC